MGPSLVNVLKGEGVTACCVCVQLGGDVEYFGAANLVVAARAGWCVVMMVALATINHLPVS
jgi:hypothetical protein